jgi:hypothetical protein
VEKKRVLSEFYRNHFSIITCIYSLSEGWDFPELDGVVFAENMNSGVRIIQALLRPCRKNINKPNKISEIILPLYSNNLINDTLTLCDKNEDYAQIIKILDELDNEDDMINTKVHISKNQIKMNDQNNSCDKELDKHILLINTKIAKDLQLKTVKRKNSTEQSLLKPKCVKHCKILRCSINDLNIVNPNWTRIISYIITNSDIDLKNITKIQFEDGEKEDYRHTYVKQKDISFRRLSSNKSFIAIKELINITGYKLYMLLKLVDGEDIEIKNDNI